MSETTEREADASSAETSETADPRSAETSERAAAPPSNEVDSDAVTPSAAQFDPKDFPPHTLNPDEAQAVHGRLSDVDPAFALPGSDQEAQAGPPGSEEGKEGRDAVEAAAERAKQANIEAGAAGSGDDTTGRVVNVPE